MASPLDFLLGLQAHGIKLGLETTHALLDAVGHPHDRYPVFHIGGTNGKGSTAAIAAAVLEAAGHRVGLYTSPHLVDVRERIRINGQMIPEAALADGTTRLREAMGAADPTFFEFMTVLAFDYFARAGIEIAVIEVGMGGRYDATNVVAPLAAAITNVALDHEAHLGPTVAAIAAEKAGIIKEGVPVVVGRLDDEAWPVVERIAAERRAPVLRWERDIHVSGDPRAGFTYDGPRWALADLSMPLTGRHQLENVACALGMLEVATTRGIRVGEDDVRAGLRAVRWEGRLEAVEEQPLLLLDGAHNPAAAEVLRDYLIPLRRARPEARLLLVMSLMRDKDRAEVLGILAPLADELVLTQASLPRAATVAELRAAVPPGCRAAVHLRPVPADALALARAHAGPHDIIGVTGSLMLVGEVKAMLRGCGLSPLRG